MRIATFLILLGAGLGNAYAQEPEVTPPSWSDGLAIGATLSPALNGSDPWLLTGLRVSVPVGTRTGIDVDGGRIFGGVNEFSSIREYAGIQIRRLRAERTVAKESTYLIFGLHYFRNNDKNRFGQPAGIKHYTAFVFGYGGDVLLRNRMRVAGEMGFSGGDGFMCFANVSLQWRPGRSD